MHHVICRTFIIGLLVVHSLGLAAQPNCQEVRAAIDIGSSTTKMVVAQVNGCTQTIDSILAPQPSGRLEFPVEWKKHIVSAADGSKVFSENIVEVGLSALAQLKSIALTHGAQRFSAVSTSAFRQVSKSHSTALIARIREQLEIPVRILTQSDEAQLGFLATIVKLGVDRNELLVWDIGGGSMQVSFWNETMQGIAGYEGTFANNAMQDFVTEKLQRHSPGSNISPNPILALGKKADPENHLQSAIRKAEEVAISTTSAQQRALLRAVPLIIGIGGVHYYSNCEVTKQSPGCEITREGLQAAILSHAHLTDDQLVAAGRASNAKYASKRITAGALTVGFMKAFGFKQVRSLKVDMADGILINSDYWP